MPHAKGNPDRMMDLLEDVAQLTPAVEEVLLPKSFKVT